MIVLKAKQTSMVCPNSLKYLRSKKMIFNLKIFVISINQKLKFTGIKTNWDNLLTIKGKALKS